MRRPTTTYALHLNVVPNHYVIVTLTNTATNFDYVTRQFRSWRDALEWVGSMSVAHVHVRAI